jgi:signal transduction histidine kinase
VGAFVRGQEILQREDRLFFLATHQAKNPLAKIVQFTGAIEKYGPKPEYLKDLSRCAKEASHNVEQVLHVERALSRRAVQTKDADLSELVADAVAGHRLAAEARQCTLSTDVEPGCRIGTVEVYVRGILDNLIDNAVKYTSEGTGRVEVRLRHSDTGYVLEVADNGLGLPTGVRETVEAGTDVRPRAGYDLRGGFGLGLFIVTSYVGLLGWRIKVGSYPPSGTVFTLYIPAAASGEALGA